MTSYTLVRFAKITALGVAVATALSGAAIARECKSDAIVAEGSPALSRNLGAYQNSLFAWRKVVAEKAGPEFNSWRYAEERQVECQEVSVGQGKRWVCTRSARPCKDTLSTVFAGEKLGKFTCKEGQISSYGRREKKESDAVEQAKWAWRIEARKTHGADWAKWDNAKDADYDCRKVGSQFQCVGVGTPCKEK